MSKKLIAALVLTGLAGGAAAVWFYMHAEAGEAEAAAEAKPALVNMDVFLTNIRSARGEHHARLEVKLAVAPARQAAYIKQDELLMARLRDQVLTQLTAENFEELRTPEGKERFRGELHKRLSPLIAGDLREVLFSDFVVQ